MSGLYTGSGGTLSLPDGESQTFEFAYAPQDHAIDVKSVTIEFDNGTGENGANQEGTIDVGITGIGVGPLFQDNLADESQNRFRRFVRGLVADHQCRGRDRSVRH